MRRAVVSRAVDRTAARSGAVAHTVVRAATAAVVAGLLLAWPAGPAQATPASARPAAGPERFHLTSTDASSARQRVQATGVFTEGGYAWAGDFASGHAVSRLVFSRGVLRLVTTATHRSVSVPDARTCKFTEVFSGNYVIRGGTGSYQHASGSGSYVSRIFGRLDKTRGGGCGAGLAAFRQSTRTQGTLHQ